ncbi:hypothetical protein BESB_047690 [Besnoitia besnoiti]|uniref:Uncharacterized protein n=1 Tax=Besnoitia besnoiti TaxID=94643 RepID=A0A2A9MLN4_BESBE|nr:hypothetical protein BESB_047690 [Besnoitia besnoiti]PFH36577.1 hypothetical protein BESB_047690 [Besnoitia besnoiti]
MPLFPADPASPHRILSQFSSLLHHPDPMRLSPASCRVRSAAGGLYPVVLDGVQTLLNLRSAPSLLYARVPAGSEAASGRFSPLLWRCSFRLFALLGLGALEFAFFLADCASPQSPCRSALFPGSSPPQRNEAESTHGPLGLDARRARDEDTPSASQAPQQAPDSRAFGLKCEELWATALVFACVFGFAEVPLSSGEGGGDCVGGDACELPSPASTQQNEQRAAKEGVQVWHASAAATRSGSRCASDSHAASGNLFGEPQATAVEDLLDRLRRQPLPPERACLRRVDLLLALKKSAAALEAVHGISFPSFLLCVRLISARFAQPRLQCAQAHTQTAALEPLLRAFNHFIQNPGERRDGRVPESAAASAPASLSAPSEPPPSAASSSPLPSSQPTPSLRRPLRVFALRPTLMAVCVAPFVEELSASRLWHSEPKKLLIVRTARNEMFLHLSESARSPSLPPLCNPPILYEHLVCDARFPFYSVRLLVRLSLSARAEVFSVTDLDAFLPDRACESPGSLTSCDRSPGESADHVCASEPHVQDAHAKREEGVRLQEEGTHTEDCAGRETAAEANARGGPQDSDRIRRPRGDGGGRDAEARQLEAKCERREEGGFLADDETGEQCEREVVSRLIKALTQQWDADFVRALKATHEAGKKDNTVTFMCACCMRHRSSSSSGSSSTGSRSSCCASAPSHAECGAAQTDARPALERTVARREAIAPQGETAPTRPLVRPLQSAGKGKETPTECRCCRRRYEVYPSDGGDLLRTSSASSLASSSACSGLASQRVSPAGRLFACCCCCGSWPPPSRAYAACDFSNSEGQPHEPPDPPCRPAAAHPSSLTELDEEQRRGRAGAHAEGRLAPRQRMPWLTGGMKVELKTAFLPGRQGASPQAAGISFVRLARENAPRLRGVLLRAAVQCFLGGTELLKLARKRDVALEVRLGQPRGASAERLPETTRAGEEGDGEARHDSRQRQHTGRRAQADAGRRDDRRRRAGRERGAQGPNPRDEREEKGSKVKVPIVDASPWTAARPQLADLVGTHFTRRNLRDILSAFIAFLDHRVPPSGELYSLVFSPEGHVSDFKKEMDPTLASFLPSWATPS